MAEIRNLERPGFFGKLLGKALDRFGVANDWQEGSTSWADAVRNSVNYVSPFNVGYEGDLAPQVPQAATDIIETNRDLVERTGRGTPQPMDGLLAFGLSSGVGGFGRRLQSHLERRAADASPNVSRETAPQLYANADDKSALLAAALQRDASGKLPMDHASRMLRAEYMGFDTSKPWYHGTNDAGFTEFNTSGKGKARSTGAWFSDEHSQAATYSKNGRRSPFVERQDAQTFFDEAKKHGDVEEVDGEGFYIHGPNGRDFYNDIADFQRSIDDGNFSETAPGIYPVYLKKFDPKTMSEVDMKGGNWDGIDAEGKPQFPDPNDPDADFTTGMSTDDIAREYLNNMGEKSVVFTNVTDQGAYGYGAHGNVRVVAKPHDIRHIDAEFDPDKAKSGNIFYANADEKAAAFGAFAADGIPFDLPERVAPSYVSGSVGGFPTWTADAEPSSPYIAARKDGSPKTTVRNAQRQEFPGIYRRPDVIAREANARVAPEDNLMYNLFGVSRRDLADIGRSRVGNADANVPFAARPRGSEAATNIMTKANRQRLVDVLGELEDTPLSDGMDGWYVMDPAYKRLEALVGPEEAKARYRQLNTLTGMASPGSEVLDEINRGTHANYLARQGRFDDFKKYGGMSSFMRGRDFPRDMSEVIGHPYHPTAHAGPMEKFLASGEVNMTRGKVPAYIQASGVPEIGFQTNVPVADAHWSRAVGLADTRTKGDYGSSASVPEIQTLTPWWRGIASDVGLEAVPAQARLWGAMAGQTGVTSPVGAPKLELLSQKIKNTADITNLPMDVVRDRALLGEMPLYANPEMPFGAASQFIIPPLEDDRREGAFE